MCIPANFLRKYLVPHKGLNVEVLKCVKPLTSAGGVSTYDHGALTYVGVESKALVQERFAGVATGLAQALEYRLRNLGGKGSKTVFVRPDTRRQSHAHASRHHPKQGSAFTKVLKTKWPKLRQSIHFSALSFGIQALSSFFVQSDP